MGYVVLGVLIIVCMHRVVFVTIVMLVVQLAPKEAMEVVQPVH